MRWKKRPVFFPVLKFGSREKPTSFLFCLVFFPSSHCAQKWSMLRPVRRRIVVRLWRWGCSSGYSYRCVLLSLLLLLSLFVSLYLSSLLVLLVQVVFLFVGLVVVPPKTTIDALPAWQSMTKPPYALSFGPLGFRDDGSSGDGGSDDDGVGFGDDDIDQSGIGKNRYLYWCRVPQNMYCTSAILPLGLSSDFPLSLFVLLLFLWLLCFCLRFALSSLLPTQKRYGRKAFPEKRFEIFRFSICLWGSPL